jgi:hypothetical protein
MASRQPFISEQLRAVEDYINGFDTVILREICMHYGADASGTRVNLHKECISLFADLIRRGDTVGFQEFKNRVFQLANAPQLGAPQSRTGLQQFSGNHCTAF